MPADRDAGVDPRFDPVFQRGYDPDKHGARRPRAMPRHATAPTPVTPIRDQIADLPPAHLPSAEESRTASGDREHEAEHEAEHEPTPRGRNPFRLALLVASLVAIGGACLLIWRRIAENPNYQGFSGTDLPRLFQTQLIEAALVPLLTAGLLGLCLWLAIGAVGQRRRNDE